MSDSPPHARNRLKGGVPEVSGFTEPPGCLRVPTPAAGHRESPSPDRELACGQAVALPSRDDPENPPLGLLLYVHESQIVCKEDLRLGPRTLVHGTDRGAEDRLGPGVALLRGELSNLCGSKRGGAVRIAAGNVLELRDLPADLARRLYRNHRVDPRWTVELIGADDDRRHEGRSARLWFKDQLFGTLARVRTVFLS